MVFLIRSLASGGAQRQLLELVKRLDRSQFAITVIAFYTGGEFWERFCELDSIEMLSACKRGRWDVVGFLVRLNSLIAGARPDIIHGYMLAANELSLLFGALHRTGIVWGVRASAADERRHDKLTRLLGWTGARLARRADLIIANSETGRRDHVGRGYPPARTIVIANGIDTERFRRDESARQRLRGAWAIRSDEPLIGIVGRVDFMKGHAVFFEAAGIAMIKDPIFDSQSSDRAMRWPTGRCARRPRRRG